MSFVRTLEKIGCRSADGFWRLAQAVNHARPAPTPFTPAWADFPIPRGAGRSFAPTGLPRETDSLCPACVRRMRARIAAREVDWQSAAEGRPGEIPARIVEQDGQIWMHKRCPEHGPYEELLSIDPAFYRRMERLAPARDVSLSPDELHEHGSSTILYGRGGVLSVDLTDRCNMMCSTCFMDANKAGTVYEPTWEEIKRILDNANSIRPRRQLSVQFSGGEPTLSPHFLDAIRYAREIGYFSVQAATNGVRFATEPGYADKCHEAGLRLAYLQFDGVTNAAHQHRNVGNLYDVKERAIEALGAAGISVVLVVTVIRGVNDDEVGPIVQFAVDNADKITVVSFQPIAFTGRDDGVTDEERRARRYTLSHLVHDIRRQTGWTDPMRDWFPLSGLSPFGDVIDLMSGTSTGWGMLKCACHAHCGTGTILFVHKETGRMVPLTEFFDLEGLLADLAKIFDAGRAGPWAKAQYLAAMLRHYHPERAPEGFSLDQAVRQFWSQTGAGHKGESDSHSFPWRVLFIAGMHFQDLYNYDFRRTEMCIIPHGTPQGEVSFCAWNSGLGWRQIVDHVNARSSTADWYREHGRHAIYAGGRNIQLPDPGRPSAIRVHPRTRAERMPTAACAACSSAGAGCPGASAHPRAAAAETTGGNGGSAHAGGNGGRSSRPLEVAGRAAPTRVRAARSEPGLDARSVEASAPRS